MTVAQLRRALRGLAADIPVLVAGVTSTTIHGDSADCPDVAAGVEKRCRGHEQRSVLSTNSGIEVALGPSGMVRAARLIATDSAPEYQRVGVRWEGVE